MACADFPTEGTDVDYVLANGTRIAHTKVFARFHTDGPATRYHFDLLKENEAVLMGWKLLVDHGSGMMKFDLKQLHL
jgi:hypothetical protein